MKRITRATCAAFILFALTAAASAAPLELSAGSTATFSPASGQPCYRGITERDTRTLTRVDGDCVFESGALRARVFATAGPGITRVDVSSEVKVIVAQFEVPEPATATAASYVPFHAVVPVSWSGQFFNMTVGFSHATANVNMYLRLREGSAADANVAGTLISQNRFQGASHGGLNQCLTVPTDYVSAAEALVGCALAVTYKDAGAARTELSAVIRTGQVYNLELVIRGDLVSPFVNDPYDAYIPERIAFDEGHGLTWSEPATLRIGTDPERTVEGLRQEVDELRALLAQLRSDFDGHYHVYLTGRGEGHNNVEALTPPPRLAPGSGVTSTTAEPLTSTGPAGPAQPDGTPQPASAAPAASVSASTPNGGGGAFGLAELGLLFASTMLFARRRGP